jgi:hypothetical protein
MAVCTIPIPSVRGSVVDWILIEMYPVEAEIEIISAATTKDVIIACRLLLTVNISRVVFRCVLYIVFHIVSNGKVTVNPVLFG